MLPVRAGVCNQGRQKGVAGGGTGGTVLDSAEAVSVQDSAAAGCDNYRIIAIFGDATRFGISLCQGVRPDKVVV